MSGRDAVPRETPAGLGDVGVELGEALLPGIDAWSEETEVLQLACETRVDSGALAQSVEVELSFVRVERTTPLTLPCSRRRELLPDDAKREELVALQAQDRLEPLDVLLAE